MYLSSLPLHCPFPFPSPQLVTTSIFSISVIFFFFVILSSSLYILDSTYKWYHTVSVFLCLTCFSKHNALQVHPSCCKWHCFILFLAESYSIVYVYHTLICYPLICCWTLKLCPYHAIVNNAAVSIEVHVSSNSVFVFGYIYTGVKLFGRSFFDV